MDKNNINTEFILSLFFKFHPDVLSNLIGGVNISKIKLEKSRYDRKIDCFSKLKDGTELFLENQLGSADEKHLKQINRIIKKVNKNNKIIVCWISNSHNSNYIELIKKEIKKTKANIEFIAIEINDELIKELKSFKRIPEFEIIQNLGKLKPFSKDSLEIVFRLYEKNKNIKKVEKNDKDKLTQKTNIMNKVEKELLKELYFIPNIHRERNIKIPNQILLGSGISDINFSIWLDRNMNLISEIRFHHSQEKIFLNLYNKKDFIEDVLDYDIKWDLNLKKIYSKSNYLEDKNINDKINKRIIRKQVRDLEKMILFFSNYKKNL